MLLCVLLLVLLCALLPVCCVPCCLSVLLCALLLCALLPVLCLPLLLDKLLLATPQLRQDSGHRCTAEHSAAHSPDLPQVCPGLRKQCQRCHATPKVCGGSWSCFSSSSANWCPDSALYVTVVGSVGAVCLGCWASEGHACAHPHPVHRACFWQLHAAKETGGATVLLHGLHACSAPTSAHNCGIVQRLNVCPSFALLHMQVYI
jgi:hypothetical protein